MYTHFTFSKYPNRAITDTFKEGSNQVPHIGFECCVTYVTHVLYSRTILKEEIYTLLNWNSCLRTSRNMFPYRGCESHNPKGLMYMLDEK